MHQVGSLGSHKGKTAIRRDQYAFRLLACAVMGNDFSRLDIEHTCLRIIFIRDIQMPTIRMKIKGLGIRNAAIASFQNKRSDIVETDGVIIAAPHEQGGFVPIEGNPTRPRAGRYRRNDAVGSIEDCHSAAFFIGNEYEAGTVCPCRQGETYRKPGYSCSADPGWHSQADCIPHEVRLA